MRLNERKRVLAQPILIARISASVGRLAWLADNNSARLFNSRPVHRISTRGKLTSGATRSSLGNSRTVRSPFAPSLTIFRPNFRSATAQRNKATASAKKSVLLATCNSSFSDRIARSSAGAKSAWNLFFRPGSRRRGTFAVSFLYSLSHAEPCIRIRSNYPRFCLPPGQLGGSQETCRSLLPNNGERQAKNRSQLRESWLRRAIRSKTRKKGTRKQPKPRRRRSRLASTHRFPQILIH